MEFGHNSLFVLSNLAILIVGRIFTEFQNICRIQPQNRKFCSDFSGLMRSNIDIAFRSNSMQKLCHCRGKFDSPLDSSVFKNLHSENDYFEFVIHFDDVCEHQLEKNKCQNREECLSEMGN